MKIRPLSLVVFFWFVVVSSYAQTDVLPKHFAIGEEERMPQYIDEAIKLQRQVEALPVNPRAMAEWEELQGIVIAWTNSFRAIQAEIIRNASREAIVYVVNQNETNVKSYLDQVGVDYAQNVVFITGPTNSIWIRDYGPNSVYINDVDSLVFVDWIYNRPRPLDDQVPQVVADNIGIQNIQMNQPPDDLVHTGGNFMSDGNGLGFSSDLVQDENGPFNNWGVSNHSKADIDTLMKEFMGIHTYVNMENLPYDLIHHIDMHMKLVDEETLIVGQYPDGIADGPQIEANLQYVIENFTGTFDRPFRVVRIPMPPDDRGRYPHQNGDYRTYANAMMVNGIVLLPTYEEQYDTTAIRIWEETLPGHEIIGIDCNDIIPLSGALHCIIKEIGASDPIWIRHQPISQATVGIPDELNVEVEVRHRDSIDRVFVYYSLDQGILYDSLALQYAGDHRWLGQLPALPEGEVIYYVEATAQTGKEITKPLTALTGGGWRFNMTALSGHESTENNVGVGEIFPNPASALTALPISVSKATYLNVELYNVNGAKVANIYEGDYDASRRHVFFNASDFTAGFYVISIQSEAGIISKKLVVK